MLPSIFAPKIGSFILFHLSLCFSSSSINRGTYFGQHLRGCFLFLRQGSQHDHWGCLDFFLFVSRSPVHNIPTEAPRKRYVETVNFQNISRSFSLWGWGVKLASFSRLPSLKSRSGTFGLRGSFFPDGESEGATARLALDDRSNRACTLGVTPGATSRDKDTTDLWWSRQKESQSGLQDVGEKIKKVLSVRMAWARLNKASPRCLCQDDHEAFVGIIVHFL